MLLVEIFHTETKQIGDRHSSLFGPAWWTTRDAAETYNRSDVSAVMDTATGHYLHGIWKPWNFTRDLPSSMAILAKFPLSHLFGRLNTLPISSPAFSEHLKEQFTPKRKFSHCLLTPMLKESQMYFLSTQAIAGASQRNKNAPFS